MTIALSYTLAQTTQSKRGDSLEAVWRAYNLEVPNRMDTTAVRLLNEIADEYASNEPAKSQEYAFKAKSFAEQTGDTRGLAAALRTIGVTYSRQGVYDKAVEHHLAALKIYEENHDKQNTAKVLNDLGITYYRQDNKKNAIEPFSKATGLYEELKDERGLSGMYNNLAGIYLDEENFPLALVYYLKASNLQEKLNDSSGLAYSLTNIGTVYHNQKQYDSALFYFTKALPIVENVVQDIQLLGDIYTNLSNVYLKQKKYPESLRYANKGLIIAHEIGSRTLREDSYRNLSDIYADIGNPKLALEFFHLYNDLKDSIYTDKIARVTLEMSAKYDAEKRKQEIATLQKEREREAKEQEQTRRNFIVGLVLIGIILMLVANGYRIKRNSEAALQKTNAQLEDASTKIRRQNHHLEELNNEKNEFMGIVAHDLKNPILSIKLLSQLLHDHSTISDEERMRFSSTIISSSDQMSRIINNLLDVNAIEQGGMKMDITPFDISVAAYTVFEEYEAIAEAKAVKLHFASNTDAECIADQTATMQILDNLVSNALKYSPSGKNVWINVMGDKTWSTAMIESGAHGVIPRTSVTTPLCVRFEIQDEGPGLSEDDKKKLFGKFMRLSAQPTNGEGSTGLGLSIVKKMVTTMNGQVWCESNAGNGATFVVELPQAVYEPTEEEMGIAFMAKS